MHNTIAHYTLGNAEPVPKQKSTPLGHLPPVYMLVMMFCGMEYPFHQFRLAVLAMLPASFLCVCLLADHGKRKNL